MNQNKWQSNKQDHFIFLVQKTMKLWPKQALIYLKCTIKSMVHLI